MSARNRRYAANVRRRFAADLDELRANTRSRLDRDTVDRLGRDISRYVTTYRQHHDHGPRRCDTNDAVDVDVLVMPMPDRLPGSFAPKWNATAIDIIYGSVRGRGWITWTREAHSLAPGPRGRKQSRTPSGAAITSECSATTARPVDSILSTAARDSEFRVALLQNS